MDDGDTATSALGNRFPEVAVYYRKTSEELRALFRSDHPLMVDPQGRLSCVGDGLMDAGAGAPPPVQLMGATGQTY